METDAKGQLGGLETPEATRIKLAKDSGSFTCPVCGKSNAEIIKDCQDRASELEAEVEDVQIPEELNLGWKDELEQRKAQHEDGEKDLPSTRLGQPEQGVRDVRPTMHAPEVAPAQPPAYASSPTPTVPLNPLTEPVPRLQQTRTAPRNAVRLQDDVVPVWIDRAIVALSVLLVAVLFRVMFA